MTIILFVVILAVLVFVHELGHFLVAKAFGVRVDEFAIGFPPRIASWKKGETTYAINLIPFGGYVKIFGEDPTEVSDSITDQSRSFAHASWYKQILILLAGITMNFLFAWLLLSFTFFVGIPAELSGNFPTTNTAVVVTSVLPHSPAQIAGIQSGDTLVRMSEGTTTLAVISPIQVQQFVEQSHAIILFSYIRGGATGTLAVSATNSVIEGQKAIGVAMSLLGTVRYGAVQSIVQGGQLTLSETRDVCFSMYDLFASLMHGNRSVLSQIAGPVGIEGLVGQARAFGLTSLFNLIALISVNLAVLNLIPFPVFDGGRVVLVFIEKITGKPINPLVVQWINIIGFVLLILLMVFVTYQDILRIVH